MILKEKYTKEIVPKMREKFGYDNNLAVPKISKITVNVGLGSMLKEAKYIDLVIKNIQKITGQTPVKTVARKAIAGFSIRENQVVGLKVTLRGRYMYEFLNKLVNVVLPRVRDFRGLDEKSFDGKGNYTMGFREHTVFPEVRSDEVEKIHGLEICISTTSSNDKEAKMLLELFGFPFKKI